LAIQKIYGIGIKDDPVPGEKRGKGIQHLTSTYWIYDMGDEPPFYYTYPSLS
jgi:hypothetical protein